MVFKNCDHSFLVQFIISMALALAYWIDGTTNLSQHSLNTLCFTDWGLTSILWIAAFSFSFLEILLLSARFNERLSRHWRDKLVDHTDHLLEAKEDKAVHFTQGGVGDRDCGSELREFPDQ